MLPESDRHAPRLCVCVCACFSVHAGARIWFGKRIVCVCVCLSSPPRTADAKPVTSFPMKGNQVSEAYVDERKDFCFQIQTPKKARVFCAADAADRAEWLKCLKRAC